MPCGKLSDDSLSTYCHISSVDGYGLDLTKKNPSTIHLTIHLKEIRPSRFSSLSLVLALVIILEVTLKYLVTVLIVIRIAPVRILGIK